MSWTLSGDLYVQGPRQNQLKRLVNIPGTVPKNFHGEHFAPHYCDVEGSLKNNKFYVTNMQPSSCRDQHIPSMARAFSDFYSQTDKYSLLAVASKDNSPLEWTFENHYYKAISSRWAALVFLAAMGETNAGFTPMASPYLMRWIINVGNRPIKTVTFDWNKAQAIIKQRDWVEARKMLKSRREPVYRMLVRADKAGVMLNPNLKEAWGLVPGASIEYGYMGLNALMRSPADKTIMFPPIQFKLTSVKVEYDAEDF